MTLDSQGNGPHLVPVQEQEAEEQVESIHGSEEEASLDEALMDADFVNEEASEASGEEEVGEDAAMNMDLEHLGTFSPFHWHAPSHVH